MNKRFSPAYARGVSWQRRCLTEVLPILALALFGLFGDSSVALAAPTPAKLPLSELEGDWISSPYAEALVRTRSPDAASEAAAALAFNVRKSGAGWLLFATSFHEAFSRDLVSASMSGNSCELKVGPAEELGAPDPRLATIKAKVVRDASGRIVTLEGSFFGEEKVAYRRIPFPVEEYAARAVVAGLYDDEGGDEWSIGVDGVVEKRGNPIGRYTVSLDPSEACCDYLHLDASAPHDASAAERIGFKWNRSMLSLYEVVIDPESCPISCKPAPFVRLLPRRSLGWSNEPIPNPAHALVRLTLSAGSPSKGMGGFVATGGPFALEFRTEEGGTSWGDYVDAKIVVSSRDGKRSCVVPADHVAPDGIYASANGSLLLLNTFSGSSGWLESYRVSDCRLVGKIDVGGEGPWVEGATILDDGDCQSIDEARSSCTPAAVWRLRSEGSFARLDRESRERTKTIYGVVFDKLTTVEDTHSPRAQK